MLKPWRVLLLLVVLGGVGSSPLAHSAEPRPSLLLTFFEPFGGNRVNYSERVASQAQAFLNAVLGDTFDVHLCQLPVVYDQAAKVAMECFRLFAPEAEMVLSLGEGSCAIRLETSARNLDDTPGFPDNEGECRQRREIFPYGPDRIGFNLPMQQMYCSVPSRYQERVRVSSNMGRFVCNNTAYHLSLAMANLPVPFGFIHVPHGNCGEMKNPSENGEIVARMILSVLDYNRSEAWSREYFPAPGNFTRLPGSIEEVDHLLDRLSRRGGAQAGRCETRFARALRDSIVTQLLDGSWKD